MSASIKTNWKDMSVGIFFSGFLTTKPFSPFLNSGDRVRNIWVNVWDKKDDYLWKETEIKGHENNV